jgi:hypothetical protein
MRTKSLLFAAAISAASMGSALAQVYSVNVVGYINITAPIGLSLIANQLDNKNGNKLADVITKLPDGSFVHFYVGGAAGYKSISYFGGFESPGAATLAPGAGAFLEIPVGAAEADRKITLVGEVPQAAASNTQIPNGLSIQSSATPRAGKLTTDLKFPAGAAMDGSLLYKYNNAIKNYETSSIFGGWEGTEPSVAVGESFFFFNASGATQPWTQDFAVK